MDEKKELIEMLEILKEQAVDQSTDVLVCDVKYDSFDFVIKKAIQYIKEH